MFKNKLIVFEGEDHSGKTTVAKLFVDYLNNNGIKAIFTKQPGDIAYGEHANILNSLCKDRKYNLDPLANLFAFLCDRAEQTAKIVIPYIKEGYTVISDRWWYSTEAYQFYGKQLLEKYKLNQDFLEWMNLLASQNLEPDIVYYLKRQQELIDLTEDDKEDIFETETYYFKKRVKEAYLRMIDKYHFKVIDVDRNPNITLGKIIKNE